MSDYEKGIEALARDLSLDDPFELYLEAAERVKVFLAEQPEVWWCEVHEEPTGVLSSRDYCAAVHDPRRRSGGHCRMVKARIVVTP